MDPRRDTPERVSTASIRRAERAAHAMDEEGPRPGIMKDGPGQEIVMGDFSVPDGGKQISPPVYPQGEEGWGDRES